MALFAECSAIAEQNGFPLGPAMLERGRAMLTTPGSTLAASMAKDIDRGARIESEAIVGDLLARRVGTANERSLLDVVYIHLKSYEARRARESASLPAR
jgi:2-dehydropantoate 2-reductase